MTGRERIFFALDVNTREKALEWVDTLSGAVGGFKLGLELFVSAGPELVRELAERGERVFLDLKFHDIPATVAGAVRAASGLGAYVLNVHCLAAGEAMKRAAEAAKEGAAAAGVNPPKVIGVTVLTSHAEADLDDLGLAGPSADAVLRLADLARDSGLDGVVASPLEAAKLRARWGNGLIVTPGVRPAGTELGDQTRVATPSGAVSSGADFIVVGRPIRAADNPHETALEIGREIDGAVR